MKGVKQHRIARAIQDTMATLLRQVVPALGEDAFASVTDVIVSRDARDVKLYVSTFHSAKAADCFATLQAEWPYIRKKLGAILGKKLPNVPHITLLQDVNQERMARIDRLLGAQVKP